MRPVERCFDLGSLGGGGDGGPRGDATGAGGGNIATDEVVAEQVEKEATNPCDDGGGQRTSQPVIIATGNKIKPELDFSTQGAFPLGVFRLYDKGLPKAGIFGLRWSSNIEYSLTFWYGDSIKCAGRLGAATLCTPLGKSLTTIYAYRSGGYATQFHKNAAGTWEDGKGNTLTQVGSNWKLAGQDGSEDVYDAQGRPLSIVDERGIGTTYTYTNNRLVTITHTTGKTLSFTWSGDKVSRITDPAGKAYVYA